jgi:GDP-4-dehydro-6-deoxy-D-mannose reductase
VLGVIADQLDLADEGSDVEVRVREDASVRDFLDIRDVADALMFLACNGRPGTSYNVCSGTGTGIASLVAIAGRAWGVRASSMPTMPEVAGASVSIGDPSALRSLGWSPRRSLEEALYALRTARTGDVTAE